MLFLYRILINIIFFISPFIVVYRLLKKKEDIRRFKEKFCFFTKERGNGKLIWFHGASVGELQSIVPLLEKLETNNNVKKVLVTSNTLSSANVIQKLRLKKIIHQFFPIDTNLHVKKFIKYWKPSSAFFIDSEIWPNMFINLDRNNIPITLLNGRITKRSFSKWKIFPSFSKKLFRKFHVCFSSSKETKRYLKKLGAKNIKFFGNLKFTQSEKDKISINNKFKKFIHLKKTWCASSTHEDEEKFCGYVHIKLKRKYKNLLTIIIPRHIERVNEILHTLKKLNLKVHLHGSKKKISKDTDIYIVNMYGNTKTFYYHCKNVFLGGSLIEHGGQNPLEAARYGCNILHGPNIYNFTEIYNFLKKNNISQIIRDKKKLVLILDKLFSKNPNTKKIKKKLDMIGQKILEKTYKEIKLII